MGSVCMSLCCAAMECHRSPAAMGSARLLHASLLCYGMSCTAMMFSCPVMVLQRSTINQCHCTGSNRVAVIAPNQVERLTKALLHAQLRHHMASRTITDVNQRRAWHAAGFYTGHHTPLHATQHLLQLYQECSHSVGCSGSTYATCAICTSLFTCTPNGGHAGRHGCHQLHELKVLALLTSTTLDLPALCCPHTTMVGSSSATSAPVALSSFTMLIILPASREYWCWLVSAPYS